MWFRSVEAPALKRVFATPTRFQSRWQWAFKQVKLRTQYASLKDYWFAPPALRLLRIHDEYIHLSRKEFRLSVLRKFVADTTISEVSNYDTLNNYYDFRWRIQDWLRLKTIFRFHCRCCYYGDAKQLQNTRSGLMIWRCSM